MKTVTVIYFTLLSPTFSLSQPSTSTPQELGNDDVCKFLDSDNQTFICQSDQLTGIYLKLLENLKGTILLSLTYFRSPGVGHSLWSQDLRSEWDRPREFVWASVCRTQHHKHCYLCQPQTENFSQQNLRWCIQLTKPDNNQEPSPRVAWGWRRTIPRICRRTVATGVRSRGQ